TRPTPARCARRSASRSTWRSSGMRARALLRRFRLRLRTLLCLQLRRLLNDLPQQFPRRSAFGRFVRFPDRRLVGCENLGEILVALNALGRELSDIHLARPFVAVFDQEPGLVVPADAHQHPRSLELHAVELELQLPLFHRRVNVLEARLRAPRSL